jgi:hypothetical protein
MACGRQGLLSWQWLRATVQAGRRAWRLLPLPLPLPLLLPLLLLPPLLATVHLEDTVASLLLARHLGQCWGQERPVRGR